MRALVLKQSELELQEDKCTSNKKKNNEKWTLL